MSDKVQGQRAARWTRAPFLALLSLLAACQLPATAVRSGQSADDQMAAGDKAMEQRRYEAAAKHYDTAERVAKDPAKVAPRWNSLASVYEGFGHDTGNQYAHRYYKRAVQADPSLVGPRLARARMLLARPEAQQLDLDVGRIVRLLDDEERLQPGRAEVASLRQKAEALRAKQVERQPERGRAYANAARMARPASARTSSGVRETPNVPGATNAEKTVGSLTCALQQFTVLGAPSPQSPEASTTAVRLRCSNAGRAKERLEASEVHLIDSNGDQFAPDGDDANFHLVFEGPEPRFLKHFLDVRKGETVDVGFTFEADYDRSVDAGLRLDVRGATFARSDAPR